MKRAAMVGMILLAAMALHAQMVVRDGIYEVTGPFEAEDDLMKVTVDIPAMKIQVIEDEIILGMDVNQDGEIDDYEWVKPEEAIGGIQPYWREGNNWWWLTRSGIDYKLVMMDENGHQELASAPVRLIHQIIVMYGEN